MADPMGMIVSGLSLGFALMRAAVGRPSISAKPIPVCNLTLEVSKESIVVGNPTWFLRAQTVPRKLELRNGDKVQWRYSGRYIHRTKGSLNWDAPWNKPDSRHLILEGAVVVWCELPHEDWVSDQTSDWDIEITVQLGAQKRRLFKGNPTTVQVIRRS